MNREIHEGHMKRTRAGNYKKKKDAIDTMASGKMDQIDPYSISQLDQNSELLEPIDQYNAGYDQPPPLHGQLMTHYMYPMNNAVIITNTGPAPSVIGARRGFTWLIPAILSALFCNFYFGILAIRMARKAKMQYDAGDVIGGRSNATCAKTLVFASCILGIVLWIVAGLLVLQRRFSRY